MKVNNICCIGAGYVGGPTMVRSAAKNYKYVTTVSNPSDYKNLINNMKQNSSSSRPTSLAQGAIHKVASQGQSLKWPRAWGLRNYVVTWLCVICREE